jgi:SAM-dependent methyltransferase
VATDQIVEGYSRSFNVDVASYFKPGSTMDLVGCEDCGLLSYDPMPAGDAAFYEALQRLPWYYQDIKPEYHFAKTHVRDNDCVLEVGCGKGVFRSFLPESVDYRGLEFNQMAIDKATAQGLNVTAETIQHHADVCPGAYDVVCHFQVLEHVSDPIGFLQACAKSVKRGGKLIVAVPAEDSFLSICEDGWLNMPPHHVSRWKDSTLRHALQKQLGLSVEAIWHEPVANYHTDWHRAILVNYALKGLSGNSPRLTNGSGLMDKLLRKLAYPKIVHAWLFERAKRQFPNSLHGHTVCAVGIRQPR